MTGFVAAGLLARVFFAVMFAPEEREPTAFIPLGDDSYHHLIFQSGRRVSYTNGESRGVMTPATGPRVGATTP